MAKIIYLSLIVLFFTSVLGLKFELPSDACIRCLCHGRSGCFFLTNCARYSISQNYWESAGSPTVDIDKTGRVAYLECMKNNDCIRETIRGYMQNHNKPDYNDDGVINCRDFAMIHYEQNPSTSKPTISHYLKRFESCYKQIMETTTTPLIILDVPSQ